MTDKIVSHFCISIYSHMLLVFYLNNILICFENNKHYLEDEKYANPRNLAAGTLNLDDAEEVKNRRVHFYAFTLVHMDDPMISWGDRMNYLEEMKFTVVS